MQPLYGHNSPETAYIVADYPYGRKVRCRLRAWIEFGGDNKGYRFVTQTEHPTYLTWNAAKKSTYVFVAACMYLDDNGHVQWSGMHEYTSAKEALAFVKRFPQCEAKARIRQWARQKQIVISRFSPFMVKYLLPVTEANMWGKVYNLLS